MNSKSLLVLILVLNCLSGVSQIADSITVDEIVSSEAKQYRLKSNYSENSNYSGYDLIYQRLRWDIDPEHRYIQGEITSHIKSKTNNLTFIEFDLYNGLTVDSIVHGGETSSFTHEEDIITIPLTIELQSDIIDSLTIYYHGEPASSGFGSFTKDEHNATPIIWTLSEPYGAKEWWPCKQSLIDKIDSIDIIVTTPEIYLTASNGVVVSNTTKDGFRTMHWKHRYPIATYLVAIAVTNYNVYNDTLQFVDERILKIENYVYPEDMALAKTQTGETVEIMKLFNQLIGDYPFANEKYGHAQFGWPGGMEHQTISFMYNFNFDLVAHELAHQWFGDYITLNSWQDIWLNEGFATYMTALTIENLKSQKDWVNWKRNSVKSITNNSDGSVFVTDTTDIHRLFNGRLSYTKGAYLLHMLRWIMGDETFFEGLQNYFNDPEIAGGFASNEQFVNHLETVADTSLTEFFNDWYYGQGFPIYSAEFGVAEDNKTWIELSQTTSHESVEFFEMPVPVRFYNSDKTDSLDFRLNNTIENQRFTLDVGFQVGDLVIDPDFWLISKTSTIATISADSPMNFIRIYPNPATDHIYISTFGTTEIWEINLFNMEGNIIKTYQENLSNIDISDLVSGIYIISIKSNKGEFNQKISKQ